MGPACPVVLAVADDALMCGLIEDVLGPGPLHVEVTDDAEAALRRIEAAPVDLVILDLGWPEANGLDVCKRLRALPNGARTPIIALSASPIAHPEVAGFALGPNEYLYKPFHIDALLRAVDRYCSPG